MLSSERAKPWTHGGLRAAIQGQGLLTPPQDEEQAQTHPGHCTGPSCLLGRTPNCTDLPAAPRASPAAKDAGKSAANPALADSGDIGITWARPEMLAGDEQTWRCFPSGVPQQLPDKYGEDRKEVTIYEKGWQGISHMQSVFNWIMYIMLHAFVNRFNGSPLKFTTCVKFSKVV